MIASSVCLLGVVCAGVVWAQLPFREYPAAEYRFGSIPLPDDYQKPAEWVFARLMYPHNPISRGGFGFRGGDWREGWTSWTIDYPVMDRHVAATVRRLTRVDARSVEQVINVDEDDDAYNWPWLYVVEPGTWMLSDQQAAKLRDYLQRGGFMMLDDFHGSAEWEIFAEGMRKVFPDRQIVDIPDTDPIFHTFWDINDRFQVPGLQFVYSGQASERGYDGKDAHWRGIYDDHNRLMVAICHNMDLGDAVEHADNPEYPERYSAQAMRIFINYLIYSMSH